MIVHKKNSPKQILRRIKGLINPKNIQVKQINPSIRIDRDVHVSMRDGTYLSANIYKPGWTGKFPVILVLHPARKDVLCKNGYHHIQYRFARIPETMVISDETSFEAPDPDFWCSNGYVIINIDKRGFGSSPRGVKPQPYFGDEEIQDIYDSIEWAGIQDWCNGNVGMFGVSYLAINQYRTATLQPSHLKAIVPWEGVSDLYSDWFYSGGIREVGFTPFLFKRMMSFGHGWDFGGESLKHPLRDEFWKRLVPEYEKIQVPLLNCISFSTQMFHSRGSNRVYERAGSEHKWLYTHRGGEWTEFYNREVLALILKFFDYFLKGIDNGMMEHPKVRLEIRESGDKVKEVRYENEFPPADVEWNNLYLSENNLVRDYNEIIKTKQTFALKNEGVQYSYIFPRDTEVVGPMKLTLYIELEDVDDANLFVGIQKFHQGKEVHFEGVYGFENDLMARTLLKVSLRQTNEEISLPYSPEYDYDTPQLVKPDEVVKMDFQFSPSATFFAKGDELRLLVQGKFFINSFRIHQVFNYEGNDNGTCIVHSSPEYKSSLYIPLIEK